MKKKIVLFIFLIISTLSCCFAGSPSVDLPTDKEARDKVYKHYSDLGWGSSNSLNSIMTDFDNLNYKFKSVLTNNTDTFYIISGFEQIYDDQLTNYSHRTIRVSLDHVTSDNPKPYLFIFKYNINTLNWDFIDSDFVSSDINNIPLSTTPFIKYTNGFIFRDANGNKLPLHQMGQLQTQVQGVELMEVLMEILKITPVTIGLIVLLIGFKKSWRFLLNSLRNY